MLTQAEKRAAQMAVNRFGADRVRVQQICRAVLTAQAQGKTVDLLDTLVGQKLLTPSEARELRLALGDTHIDPIEPIVNTGGSAPLPDGRGSDHYSIQAVDDG